MLPYQMLFTEHDDEHVQVLLKFSKEQWTLHQDEVFATETQEYRTWMIAASQKGCRGLFRTLKKDEMPYIRPFQSRPRTERMAPSSKYHRLVYYSGTFPPGDVANFVIDYGLNTVFEPFVVFIFNVDTSFL